MKEQIKDTTYFSVQAWMVTKLNLRGAERDVYAIIYGFSQDNDSDFHGSLDYISQLTGYSRNAICTALKSLTERGLILKTENVINNIKYCKYRTSGLYSVQVACTENEKSVQVACTNNKHTNISKDILVEVDNKEDNNIEWFLANYHDICSSLPKVMKLTEKRKKGIRKLLKTYSKEDIIACFENAENSDFLIGKNDRRWKADIDFILREDKFVAILEGKYGGRKASRDNLKRVAHKTQEEIQNEREVIRNGGAKKF